MNTVAIIGGTLQGLEATYLAHKAGIRSIVIDKKTDAIARNMADTFICMDVLNEEDRLIDILKSVDFVLPAMENLKVINKLKKINEEYNFIICFDFESYAISSSKILSDKMIHEYKIPSPKYYPYGKPPYIVKPSESSGSENVKYIENKRQLKEYLEEFKDKSELIIQEYVSGPSYSIEIIGLENNYKTYQITEIVVDSDYDCKRVYSPCDVTIDMKNQFKDIALNLGKALKLKGIMDVEVIEHNGILKVLEIDARIPSQTPTVVYHSTGINFLEEIRDVFLYEKISEKKIDREKYVSYEHIFVSNNKMEILGEHIMVDVGFLNHKMNFCGADEVLTNYVEGSKEWIGTFINIAESKIELEIKRSKMFKEIELLHGEGNLELIDLSPRHK